MRQWFQEVTITALNTSEGTTEWTLDNGARLLLTLELACRLGLVVGMRLFLDQSQPSALTIFVGGPLNHTKNRGELTVTPQNANQARLTVRLTRNNEVIYDGMCASVYSLPQQCSLC